jgi:hypothetical protein
MQNYNDALLTWEEEIVPRRIFGPNREEVTGGWKKLHNEEFHTLYPLPYINRVTKLRRMKWAGYVALLEQMRSAYKTLVGKPERKGLLGRSRCRWEDIIKLDLKEIRCEYVYWIHWLGIAPNDRFVLTW